MHLAPERGVPFLRHKNVRSDPNRDIPYTADDTSILVTAEAAAQSDVLRSATLPCGTATILIPGLSHAGTGTDPSSIGPSHFRRIAAQLGG